LPLNAATRVGQPNDAYYGTDALGDLPKGQGLMTQSVARGLWWQARKRFWMKQPRLLASHTGCEPVRPSQTGTDTCVERDCVRKF